MMATRGAYRLVLTAAGSEEQARTLARELVERRLAACVNVVGPACSVYRWKGKVVQEEERLLLIKTTVERYAELAKAIRELHTYDVPELLSLPIDDGDAAYLDWLSASVAPETD